MNRNKCLLGIVCALVAMGTTAAAYAVPSFVSVSGRGTEAGPPYSGQAVSALGQDTISLELSDGSSQSAVSLTLSTGTTRVNVVSALGNSAFNATGTARIDDAIFIVGDLPNPITAFFSFAVDGTVTIGGGPPPELGAAGNSGFALASLNVQTVGFAGSAVNRVYATDSCVGFPGSNCQIGTSFVDILTASFTIDDAHRNVLVTADLYGEAYNGSRVDFGNTGTLSLFLPSGLTFTSESGLLLTDTVIPEPSTLALMLAGLGILGGLAHRNRAKRM